jgi:hypothetical protein
MDDDASDEVPFVRPYLNHAGGAAGMPPPPPPAPSAEGEGEGEAVRPYMLTGGRVHDSDDAVEKIYQSVAESDSKLSREHEQVLALCAEAQSVAEISAHLNLPLGVAAVLARDLMSAGLLVSSADNVDVASDVSIILRLKDAIRSL